MYAYVQKLNCKIRYLVILTGILIRNVIYVICIKLGFTAFETLLEHGLYILLKILENFRYHNENINSTAR